MEPYGRRPREFVVWAASVFLVFIVGYSIYYAIAHRITLSKNVRYTIGTTKGTKIAASGRLIIYEYIVNGKTYRDYDSYSFNSQEINGHYLVKFSAEDPDFNEFHQNIGIPDNYPPPPSGGWKILPGR